MMEGFVAWVFDNKEWFFSGVGLPIVAWVGRVIFKKIYTSSAQSIRSGDCSTNIQAGRDVNMGTKTKGNDVEDE